MFSLVGVMVILLAWIATPNRVGANPGLAVVPLEHDSGEVELNWSISTGVIVTNTWFDTVVIEDIYMATGNSPDFTYELPSLFDGEIPPQQSIEIQVTYSPSALGPASAVLNMLWANGEPGVGYVALVGVGVELDVERF